MGIPEKLYFRIGEVAQIVGVAPHVLRYWEGEFREISPVKSRTNQRRYRRRDVERILKIKELLYQEGYTIAGARKRIRARRANGGGSQEEVERLRRELDEVRRLLEG